MKVTISQNLARLTALMVGAVMAASCTSEKIAYKTQPSFTAPPAAAANFVGYADTTTKQTVCGNCHVEKQAEWAQTHHANAWADLQATGHAGAACVPCHTVNSYGNATADTLVGFLATSDPRYQDVQCESCHGPGLVHVTSPTSQNEPLASINVDTGGVPFGTGCAECHNGLPHNPFVNEWIQSAHGTSAANSHAIGQRACVQLPFRTGRARGMGREHQLRGSQRGAHEPDSRSPAPSATIPMAARTSTNCGTRSTSPIPPTCFA